MAELRIRMKKGRDGPHTLACTRADGSTTVQHNRQGFFPLHDLMHYAVETVLGYRRGFYGLVAQGWGLEDFGAPWPRGRLPADLDPVEEVVGRLDLEAATGHPTDAGELNAMVREWAEGKAWKPAPITAAELDRIRALAGDLRSRWLALEPGGSIDLVFGAGPPSDLDAGIGGE